MKDELLIKFLLKEASEEENTVVKQWLETDPANQLYFTQFEKIWNAGKNLASKSNVNEEQAWLKFKEKTHKLKNKESTTTLKRNETVIKPLKSNFNWLKIAAVLVLVAGAWMAYSVFAPTGYTELVAGKQVRVEMLPDGSEITLNKHAAISYAADFKDDRRIKLNTGDVFFNVAHDKTRPFVIAIDKISVTVVGTSFNIKHLKGETEVIVETGIVRVKQGNDEIELRKGEKVLISTASAKLIKEQNSDQLYTYYRSKVFTARDTPLSKLVEVLNEAYDAQIVLDDELINHPVFTTLKADDSLEDNLIILSETLDLKIIRNQNQIRLSKNK